MTRKNMTVEWMKIVESTAQKATQTSTILSILKQDPTSSPELLDYAWDKEARAALKIKDMTGAYFQGVWHDFTPGYVDTGARDLRRIFERFKLDPDDPWSWRTMAEYMSMLVSLPQRKRGRPVVYTPEKLMQIRQERESGPLKNLTDSKAAKPLAKKYAGSTRKSGTEGMRKQIRKARLLGTK
jgi:hypothetical protein